MSQAGTSSSRSLGNLDTSIAEPAVPFIDLVAQHRSIERDVMAAVGRVFSEQRFILGDEVAEFECDVAKYCDSRVAVGCASGTDALVLSLMALGIGPGDEVITSPFTFFATASSIHRVGAKPVFVDIDPATFNLNPDAVAAAVTERTRAIMPVHLFGLCADMDPLWRIAARGHLAIVEDACQAIGAEYRSRRAGVLGTIGNFSFFPTKNLGGAGDGGMMTTDDSTLANRLRRLRMHGDIGQYEHIEVGLNSRLDALQAAVLRVKMQHLEAWTLGRQRNARRYDNLIAQYGLGDVIQTPSIPAGYRHVFNQYTVRVRDGLRNQVMQSLRSRQLGCAVYYPKPLHLQECFRDLGYVAGDFAESEAAARDVLSLPIFAELQESQQEQVIRGIATAIGRNGSASRTTSTSVPAATPIAAPAATTAPIPAPKFLSAVPETARRINN